MRGPPASGAALFVAASLLAAMSAGAHEYVATITLAEGGSTLLAGTSAVRPVAGVRLHHCDIVDTGLDGFVQLETDDGGVIELGSQSRLVSHLPARHGQAPVVGPQYLLEGWAKITVPKRAKGLPHRVDTPLVNVVIERGTAALQVAAGAVRFFVESGQAVARVRGGTSSTVVRAGNLYSIKVGFDRGTLVGRATRDFLSAMPRSFRDTLPARLASLKDRNVTPRPVGDYPAAEVRNLLAVDDEMRLACANRH